MGNFRSLASTVVVMASLPLGASGARAQAVSGSEAYGQACRAIEVRETIIAEEIPGKGERYIHSQMDWITADGAVMWVSSGSPVHWGLVETRTGEFLPITAMLRQHSAHATAVSTDRELVVTVRVPEGRTAAVLRLSGEAVARIDLPDHTMPKFTPAGDAVYYAVRTPPSPANRLTVRRLDDGHTFELVHLRRLSSVAVSRDLSTAATWDGRLLRVWTLPNPRLIFEEKSVLSGDVLGVRVSDGGERVAVGVYSSDRAQYASAAEALAAHRRENPHRYRLNGETTGIGRANSVIVFDAKTGERIAQVAPPDGKLKQISPSGDEALFRVGDRLVVYALPSGEPLRHYDLPHQTLDEMYSEDLGTVVMRDRDRGLEWVYALTPPSAP